MSNSEEPNIFSIMCRLCLSRNVELIDLYVKDEFNTINSSDKILEIIERFTTVKIHPSDNLPQRICETCINTVKSMLAFQNQCKQNDAELHKMLDKSVNVQDCEKMNGSENVDESEDMVERLDGTPNIFEVNVDELESDDDTANKEQQSKFATQHSDDTRPINYGTVACHICGKLYSKYNLQFHLNKHDGQRPYRCDIDDCTSTFTAPYHLKMHKRDCHRNPKWTCDVCGKAFKRNQALRVHRRTHFDPDIPCKICHKLFTTPNGLSQHMLVHTQDRKFKCDSCKKSFLTNYTLRIHKRVHTQEKPYSCDCGVSFAYNCLLKAHKEKHHKDSEEAMSLPPSL